jgi:type IV secretory pathway TraG/TraD family ATPase VirD4
MRETWGRIETAGQWPHPRPVWTVAVLVIALSSATGIQAYDCTTRWTPLQRWYVSAYVRSGLIAGLGFTRVGQYRLLHVVDSTNSRLALDDEVASGPAVAGMPFRLTNAAVRVGDRALVWHDARYRHQALHAFLRHWIYRDKGVVDLGRSAAWTALLVFAVGAVIAIPMDLARGRARRHGRRLKGPELVSVAYFNRRFHADGVGFRQTRTRGRTQWLRIPRAIESSHVLIMGDSGTGKSVLIRQLLEQIEARGESAIVYDPALEYTGQFYAPDRGDVILNPLDARSPFWSPGDEWRHEAETLTLATSLFPDRHHENTFFTEGPRRIFAYLLTLRPTPDELAFWLCHEDELDRRVRGTAYAAMIDRQAPAQRSGVLASLNMVADTLQLLPTERDTTRRWSAAGWATSRTGWLFLTSTPETRPRLVPLISLWLDTLVLRLMNQGQAHPRRTWFILDELASLQRLPQLHTAITENRKSNNPVVLGFQGRSQLETRYGHDAEAMLSQPATKIFLRTSEPRAAKWIAEAIGDLEIERLRESRSHGRGGQQTYGLERQVEPLVMASEISGLPALRGYLKVGNFVVRLSAPFLHRPQIQQPFIERTRTRASRTTAPLKPDAEVSSTKGTHTQDVHRSLTRGRELELE